LSTVVDVLQRELTLAENEAAIQQMPEQFAIDTNPPRASGKRRRARSGKPLKGADRAPQVSKLDQDSAEVLRKTTEGPRRTIAEKLKTESGLHWFEVIPMPEIIRSILFGKNEEWCKNRDERIAALVLFSDKHPTTWVGSLTFKSLAREI
jgi:hypothetical protein